MGDFHSCATSEVTRSLSLIAAEVCFRFFRKSSNQRRPLELLVQLISGKSSVDRCDLGAQSVAQSLEGGSSPSRMKVPPSSKSNPATSHSACRAGAGKFKTGEDDETPHLDVDARSVSIRRAGGAGWHGSAKQPIARSQDKAPKVQAHRHGHLRWPNSFYFSEAVGQNVNNQGTVVGAADTSLQDPYYPNCDTPGLSYLARLSVGGRSPHRLGHASARLQQLGWLGQRRRDDPGRVGERRY